MNNYTTNPKNPNYTEISQTTSILIHLAAQALIEKQLSAQNTSSPVTQIKSSSEKKRTNGTVDPISDPADIQIAKEYFLNKAVRYSSNPQNIRDYALFVVGINSARRIGDIVKIQVSDLFNPDFSWKKYLFVNEQKTGKPIRILINDSVKAATKMLLNSLENYNLDTYLFQSRCGSNQPIETRSVHRILKEMSRATGLDKKYNIGTHSMRKTWARNYYVKHPTEIVKIQKALNHSSPEVTLRYIGIEQEEMDEMFSEGL